MKDLEYPIDLLFNVSSFSNDFTAKDAQGRTVAYVKQKLFKFKEAISVYDDETRNQLRYKIAADRWIDFSAAYNMTYADGTELGKVARKGWRSLWKAKYLVIDQHQKEQFTVEEENGWIKVWDSLFSEIPIIGLLSGYVFNPSYAVRDMNGKALVRLKKQKSMLGRRFQITKLADIDADDRERLLLSLMMMILLERRRG